MFYFGSIIIYDSFISSFYVFAYIGNNMWKVYADGNLVYIVQADSKEHAIEKVKVTMVAEGQCDTVEGLVFHACHY